MFSDMYHYDNPFTKENPDYLLYENYFSFLVILIALKIIKCYFVGFVMCILAADNATINSISSLLWYPF